MAAPPAYLDECIHYRLVSLLRARGFTVTHVDDEQTKGYDDDQQLEYATRHQWVFVTQNQGEFYRRHLTWQQLGRQHSGLVLVPQSRLPLLALRVALLLDWLAVGSFGQSPLARWGDLQAELARGYRVNRMYSESEIQRAI